MLTQPALSRQARRKQERALKKEVEIKTKAVIKVKQLISKIFDKENIKNLAYATGFIKRKRKLNPIALVVVLMLGCNGQSIETLASMCSDLRTWFDITIKPQSLQAKINSPNTKEFMKVIINEIMKSDVNRILNKAFKKRKKLKKWSGYKRILIQDSTVISLHENLSRIFKGCGGGASKSSVKCDFIIDLVSNQILYMKCISGKEPDAKLSDEIINYAEEGDLILRDLGYFNLNHFDKIIKNKTSFISRLSKSVYVYLNKDDENHLDLIKHIEEKIEKNEEIDFDVYIGKDSRVKVRLVGIKVPQEVVDKRREQRKKNQKKEPSDSLNEWNGYTLMITNISSKLISLKCILKLYKLRWQIELFFKTLKSVLSIDNFTGTNKYRILCFLYLKLCICWVVSILYSCAQSLNTSDIEVSSRKFVAWLVGKIGVVECIYTIDGFDKLFKAFERDKDLLYKKKDKVDLWLEEEKRNKNNV